MTDERLGMAAGAMLRGIDRPPRDSQASVDVVMAQVRDMRQVRRWWPFGRLPALPVLGLPSRELAPALIAATNERTRPRGSTMFSAVQFVVAGVIVALFGGFLLAGLLTIGQGDETAPAAATESPWPMTTDALLPGVTLTVEEIEPGVFHTLDDGVRDLARLPIGDWGAGATVTVDEAGAVWRFTSEGAFRLGAEGDWHVGGSDTDLPLPDSATARGRVVTGPDVLTDLLGPESATPKGLGLDGGVAALEAQADGTIWLLGNGGSLVRVPLGGVAEVLDWHDVYDGLVDGLAVTPEGDAWLMGKSEVGRYPAEVFLHFAGRDWEVVPVPTESLPGPLWAGPLDGNQRFDVGPDGTLWADLVYRLDRPGDLRHRSLARYDGSNWTVFGEEDGVRPWDAGMWPYNMDREMRVAPDGSVWVIASGSDEPPCAGLGRFDGESWTSFVVNMCIASYDVAPDGAVWVVAGDRDAPQGLTIETYVITPEAVEAKVATGTEPTPATATPSPLPMATGQLLPGMVTEEVEPGVYRVVNDGVRDLRSVGAVDVVAGQDGGTWLLREDEFFRLGSDGSHGWPLAHGPMDHVFEVAPDGTMWVIPNADSREGPALRSTDGEEWTIQPCPEDSMNCQGFTVAPDGSVWASWEAWNGVWQVSHLGPTGWQVLEGDMPDGSSFDPFDRFFFTDAGEIYASGCDPAWFCWLQRYEDGIWQHHRQARNVVAVGPDGTTWDDGGIGIWGNDDPAIPDPPEGLVRLADGKYESWTPDDLFDVRFGFGFGLDYEFEVAPDGSLWFSLWRTADGDVPEDDDWDSAALDGPVACEGLARFDGQALERFVPGRCISLDIAADGSVWLLADNNLYVITPVTAP